MNAFLITTVQIGYGKLWLYLMSIASCPYEVVLGDPSSEGLCLQPGVRVLAGLVAFTLERGRCGLVRRASWCGPRVSRRSWFRDE